MVYEYHRLSVYGKSPTEGYMFRVINNSKITYYIKAPNEDLEVNTNHNPRNTRMFRFAGYTSKEKFEQHIFLDSI